MTRLHDDPRLTAYALGELDAEEEFQFGEALLDDGAARFEVEDIGRAAALVRRELAGPTGLGLSEEQKLQLQGEWQARSARDGVAGAPGNALDVFEDRTPRHALLAEFARPKSLHGARERKRFAKALVAAVLLHGTAAAAVVIFPSTARELLDEPQEGVAFAPRPSPEAPRVSVAIELPPSLRTDTFAQPPLEPLLPPIALNAADLAPKYPAAAQRRGIGGTVVVIFDVLEDGSVAAARAVSGPSVLFESVIRAVESWRFEPARRGGKPVRYSMTASVTFRLDA